MKQEYIDMEELRSRIEKVESENKQMLDWAMSNASLLIGYHQDSTQKKEEKKWMLEENQLKAAYALNLCTVSVSQIVDYHDLYILEQEYEGILNNLNLENIPHDDELLSILKQILDTITFFRIQEGEKRIIEKRYQKKMKSAIWSSVPNLSVILTTTNPVALAVSLISQVGIGYMNYRKEKAKINDEMEEERWKLQRSAIDQFNTLRRDLFETAWKLASKYHFPDEYRLTERQINQYNQILMDPDPLRRYERLAFVKDQFKAYPNFHFYLGDAANDVAQDTQERYTPAMREKFKALAKECFKSYKDINNTSLLRTDPICSACNLTYIDLLDPQKDEACIIECLDKAVAAAGNSLDIIQICAMGYLRMKRFREAEKYLRMLTVEGFNTSTNAQLLSRLYLQDYITNINNPAKLNNIRSESDSLSLIANNVHLFELPSPGNKPDLNAIESSFISAQIASCLKVTKYIAESLVDQVAALFNREYLNPYPNKEHSLDYFLTRAWEVSLDNALHQEKVKTAYLQSLGTKDSLLHGIAKSLNDLDRCFKSFDFWEKISTTVINEALDKSKNKLESLQEKIWAQTYETIHSEDFTSIRIKKDFLDLYKQSLLDTAIAFLKYVGRPDNKSNSQAQFSSYEHILREICENHGIVYPEWDKTVPQPYAASTPDRIGSKLIDLRLEAIRGQINEWYQNLDEAKKQELTVLFQDSPYYSKRIDEIKRVPAVKFANDDLIAILVYKPNEITYYILKDKVLSLHKKKTAEEMYSSFSHVTDYQECKLPLIGFDPEANGTYKDIGNLLILLHKFSKQS